jgi:hypothetical protein
VPASSWSKAIEGDTTTIVKGIGVGGSVAGIRAARELASLPVPKPVRRRNRILTVESIMFLLSTFVASWLLAAAPAVAQETGNFVIRLGRDTTAVEHFTQSATRIEVDQAGRVPRVLTRHIVYEFSPKGDLKGIDITVSRPGAGSGSLPIQRIHATLDGDSLRGEVRRDTTATPLRSAAPAGTIVNIGSPWLMYEHLAMKFVATKAESLHAPLVYLGGTDVFFATVRRLGKDSLDIRTPTDHFHARADRAGHLLNVVPLAGTQQFTVDRVPSLDVAATAASFLATEQQGGAMGTLSSRDTVKANVGGATLWIDYGRPPSAGARSLAPWCRGACCGAPVPTPRPSSRPTRCWSQAAPRSRPASTRCGPFLRPPAGSS